MPFNISVYPTLYDTDSPTPTILSLEELTQKLSVFVRTDTKASVPLFGPYRLSPPPSPCKKHLDGVPRVSAHRCDVCVSGITLATFDADIGTEEELLTCEELLAKDDLTRIWYSSHSYNPELGKRSMRLVLPLQEECPPGHWASFRKHLILKYKIPAELTKCSGKSHSYYFPSCPPNGEPVFEFVEGKLLSFVEWAPEAKASSSSDAADLASSEDSVPFTWPEETNPPLDEYISRVESQIVYLTQKNQPKEHEKAERLRRLLKGEALAEHGDRNTAMASVTASLANMFPDAPRSVFVRLLEDSITIMIANGSRLTAETVMNALIRALIKVKEKLASVEAAKATADATKATRKEFVEAARRAVEAITNQAARGES